MVASQATYTPAWSMPPGRTIKRLMLHRGLSIYELSIEIEVSEEKTEALIEGELQINEKLAERLSAALGSSSAFWINREKQYRQDLERLQNPVNSLTALDEKWARSFPLKDMHKFGWFPSTLAKKNSVDLLQEFFGVTSAETWRSRYAPHASLAAFRTSPTFESNPAAVTAWLRWGEIQSENIQCNDWNVERLAENLSEMRKLTRRNHPSKFIPELRRLCADAGVALVIAPAPTGCRASGATRFLSPTKALIVLSVRYKSDDHFWFTFFHEVGHLVLHAKEAVFLEDGSDINSEEEIEANKFSEDVLIPPIHRDELLQLRARSEEISRFSVKIGLSSGIVVGQLQHLGRIGRNQMNHLKRSYSLKDFERAITL